MDVETRPIGEDAYAVCTEDGRELGVVRLVDVTRQRPRWDGRGGFAFPSTERVWVIDGYSTHEFGSRRGAVEILKRLAERDGRFQ